MPYQTLITGGTGFVGTALAAAAERDQIEISVMGRTPNKNLASRAAFIQHDVTQPFPRSTIFDAIVHAATPASAVVNIIRPREMLEVIVRGTINALSFAAAHHNTPDFLFISSGAVYGEMPKDIERFDEACRSSPSVIDVSSAYAEGKRIAELLVAIANFEGKCRGRIARLFAFSGPNLPRDRHFAVGNFVRDAVNKQCIVVRSDGSAIRSYLDEKDMAEWILAILKRGEPGFPYHVGSERAISIKDLAFLVARRYEELTNSGCSVEILGERSLLDGVSRYVPSTKQTRQLLGVEETVSLEESIDSMIRDAIATGATEY